MKKLSLFALIFLIIGCSKDKAYNNLGVLYSKIGSEEQANAYYLKALTINPEQWVTRYNYSLSDAQLEQVKNAITELEQIKKTGIKDPDFLYKVYFALGFLHGLTQNIPQALAAYQQALGIYPDSIDVKNNIEVLFAKSGGNQNGKSSDENEGKKSKDGKESQDSENKDSKKPGQDETNNDIKGRDDSSLKRKKLTKKEIEQILKEIKNQESKVRSKENLKNNQKGKESGKTW